MLGWEISAVAYSSLLHKPQTVTVCLVTVVHTVLFRKGRMCLNIKSINIWSTLDDIYCISYFIFIHCYAIRTWIRVLEFLYIQSISTFKVEWLPTDLNALNMIFLRFCFFLCALSIRYSNALSLKLYHLSNHPALSFVEETKVQTFGWGNR